MFADASVYLEQISLLDEDAAEEILRIFIESKPDLAPKLVDLTWEPNQIMEPPPNAGDGRYRGMIKNWWEDKGYGFITLDCDGRLHSYWQAAAPQMRRVCPCTGNAGVE